MFINWFLHQVPAMGCSGRLRLFTGLKVMHGGALLYHYHFKAREEDRRTQWTGAKVGQMDGGVQLPEQDMPRASQASWIFSVTQPCSDAAVTWPEHTHVHPPSAEDNPQCSLLKGRCRRSLPAFRRLFRLKKLSSFLLRFSSLNFSARTNWRCSDFFKKYGRWPSWA